MSLCLEYSPLVSIQYQDGSSPSKYRVDTKFFKEVSLLHLAELQRVLSFFA